MESDELYDSLDDDRPANDSKTPAKRREYEKRKSKSATHITVIFNRDVKNQNSSDSDEIEPLFLDSSREVSGSERGDYSSNMSSVYEGSVKLNEFCDLSEVVPLYDGEIPKQSLKGLKANLRDKRQIRCGRFKNKTGINAHQGLNFKEQKTYSNIFHAKMDKLNQEKPEPTETARAQCGGNTDRSDVSAVSSHFSDAKSSISDSTSFYMDLLNKQKPNSRDLKMPAQEKLFKKLEIDGGQSGSDFNLKSISQYLVPNNSLADFPENVRSSHTRKFKSKMSIVTPPILGSLGPDMEAIQDKLSLLKKRRSYGQRVSDRNRIKMKEMQVLKDLNEELKKCRM